jgi:hypothetical protein
MGLRMGRCKILVSGMARISARFRVSIKDQQTKRILKVELIDAPGLWGERRYRIRMNDRHPDRIKEATLTEIFERLRRWVVQQAEARCRDRRTI